MGDRMSCLNVYVGSVLCASALVLAAAGDVRADQRVSNTGKPADQVVEHVRPVSLVSDEDRRHWAFQKPVAFRPPEVNAVDRVRTPIDRFLLAKLEQNGLTYSLDADRLTLVRRASMDLVGLPPSLDEVQRFLDDGRADAYEQLIDRLLASPHYGERWGRHWLDAAGYVDVRLFDGDLMSINVNDGMWRYRDYVIQSFNADKSYDRFLVEQLAGDELVDWQSDETWQLEKLELLVATGYLRNVEDPTGEPQYGIKQRYDLLFDLMGMVSTSTLGLTLQCARCHSHKYDPIPQRDYYRWMACFETSYNVHDWLKPQDRFVADVPPAERAAIDAHNAPFDKQLEPLRKQVMELEGSDEEAAKSQVADLNKQIAELDRQRLSYGKIQALWDNGDAYTSRLLRRGGYDAPGAPVDPGFLEVLSGADNQLVQRPPGTREGSSGRRLALARWLTDNQSAAGGLVARVIVNRAWQHHFGVGIVDTPGNFGRSGSPPSHPELLDYLAIDFMQHGWSLKHLHRLIMASTAYRQVSESADLTETPHAARPTGYSTDSSNRLLWRMNLRRIEAEIVRDSLLAVAGNIDLAQGGPPVMITIPSSGLSTPVQEPTPTSHLRRSIYLLNRRIYPLKFLELFDAPIMPVNCTSRLHSATVLQSLAVLNDPFVTGQARVMADRVVEMAGEDVGQQIGTAYRLALVRGPHAGEVASCRAYLADQQRNYVQASSTEEEARQRALADLCQTILCTNEFLYVD